MASNARSPNAKTPRTEAEGSRIRGSIKRGRPLHFYFEGLEIGGFEGETVAGALLAAGIRTLRRAEISGDPRGLFCGMGVCFECRMMIDGQPNTRACMTTVRPGMRVRTG